MHIYHIITVLLITPIYSDIDAMIICLYVCPGVHHIAIQITSSFSNIIGMLSKSLGQALRISVAMHILFHNDDYGNELSSKVTQAAIEAVINFVEVCCQHTAYIAGHSDINEQLKLFETGMVKGIFKVTSYPCKNKHLDMCSSHIIQNTHCYEIKLLCTYCMHNAQRNVLSLIIITADYVLFFFLKNEN